jgi:hypothetical protein
MSDQFNFFVDIVPREEAIYPSPLNGVVPSEKGLATKDQRGSGSSALFHLLIPARW